MSDEQFEATFQIRLDRGEVWRRLTAKPSDVDGELWMPGFDSTATIKSEEAGARLHVVKKDPPFEGTDIVVTLVDDEHGTRVRVVQSGFGVLPGSPELFALGWRRIVADLRTYLTTGVHARRFLPSWADLGDTTVPAEWIHDGQLHTC